MAVLQGTKCVDVLLWIWEFKNVRWTYFQERHKGTLRQASLSRGAPSPFLKALTRFLNIPNPLRSSCHACLLPYIHFHRHLKQIAAPAGTCYLRKHPAPPRAYRKSAERRIQKREKEAKNAGAVLR